MDHQDLNKHDKKIIKELLEKGVQAEFQAALDAAADVLSDWKATGRDNRTAYHNLYKKIKEHDKIIARRYDGLTGSRYVTTVAMIYADGHITEEDLKDLSQTTRDFLNSRMLALKSVCG